MNPFLPLEHCVPDGEVKVFSDRCYIYGSYDLENGTDYCSSQYHVFSAGLEDLEHWSDHGTVLTSGDGESPIAWSRARLYAPDACEKNGKYYLYFCMSDGTEGVAESDTPAGPFRNVRQLFYPHAVRDGAPLCDIDPAVFVDDDGSVYYYWGQFHLQAAKLKKNMYELDGKTYTESLISESTHWFHEGASVRKIRGRYYLVFCSVVTGRANTLDYAVSDSPLGPFTYCGSIIDNRSCDPESWNIHGGIQKINGEYYVFYHRSSNNSKFSRRACVEKIEIDEDGFIHPVQMTSLGFSKALPAEQTVPAAAVCERTGQCYLRREKEGLILKNICTANTAIFRYLEFTGESWVFTVRLRGIQKGIVNLRLDDPGAAPAAVLSFEGGHVWRSYSIPVRIPRGKHSLYLDFHGAFNQQSLCELESLCFSGNERIVSSVNSWEN